MWTMAVCIPPHEDKNITSACVPNQADSPSTMIPKASSNSTDCLRKGLEIISLLVDKPPSEEVAASETKKPSKTKREASLNI